MNKTIKGSLAAGAAAVLLLGGAGSLAYWTDDATVNGGTINSGFLTLDDGVCDDKWVHTVGPKATAAVVNFVPGDVITKNCTFVIGAQGDNLSATPVIDDELVIATSPETVSDPQVAGEGKVVATVDTVYTLGEVAYNGTDAITEQDNTKKLVATITVSFPYGTDETGPAGDGLGVVNGNDTQNVVASLNDLSITLTQVDPNA